MNPYITLTSYHGDKQVHIFVNHIQAIQNATQATKKYVPGVAEQEEITTISSYVWTGTEEDGAFRVKESHLDILKMIESFN